MTAVAPRTVNSVSYVTRINDEVDFSWQAQYLVRLDNDTCCSAHYGDTHFSWQAQYLVRLVNGCCSAHCKKRFMCEKD